MTGLSGGGQSGRMPRERMRLIDSLPGGVVLLAAFAGGFAASAVFAGGGGALVSALVGAFALAGAYGIASRLWGRAEAPTGADLATVALAASSDAMAVVEDGVRVVEANVAYLELCGAAAPAQAPAPERLLSRRSGSQSELARILAAIADGVGGRFTLPAGGEGDALRIEVRPLDNPRRVLWALTPMMREGTEAGEVRAAEAEAPAAVARAGVEPPAVAEARWRDALPVAVGRLREGVLSEPNGALLRLIGRTAGAFGAEGCPIDELVSAGDLPALRAGLADPVAEGLALHLRSPAGTLLPVLLHLAPPDADGGRLAVAVPRPEGKAAPAERRALREDVASASALTEVGRFFVRAPLAMAVVDAAGMVNSSNGAFDRLFGTTDPVSEAIRPLAGLAAGADGEAIDTFLAEVKVAGMPLVSCDIVIAGAGARSARLYAAPLEQDGGDIALCAIETTEQKALEAQFAQSQKLQAVGHLAGGVAHDFNNVLTAIIGYCDLLLAKHRPSDPSFPDIMQIKQNANRAAGLVRQLLAFSRRQTLRPQVIALTDVISDVSELLRRLIGERITLDVQHGRDLWPVKVDVNQFEQVIVNLVVNARDAMPAGGTLTVRTANVPEAHCADYGQGGLPPADYVLVEVEDTGTGIPPEVMDKIFEPFFSTKEVGKGTGLGLSTVYGIVQQTGGTILAASVPGQGSTFRVFLPRHVAEAVEEAPRPVEPEVKSGDLTGHGRVLLVEDEDAVRAFSSRALEGRGFEVLTATSGADALAVMEEHDHRVDLVISDVVMPEMDGPTLLRELRARNPGLKVIFISGYAEDAFAKNLPPDQQFAFLPKPFSLKQLVAAVNQELRG